MSTIQLLFPQEIEVWYIIPALRKELAKELKKLGLNQTEIAEKLGITKSAVSQYISGKRGSEVNFSNSIKSKIQESAAKIATGSSIVTEINSISKEVWKTDFLCKLHKEHADLPVDCNLCGRGRQ